LNSGTKRSPEAAIQPLGFRGVGKSNFSGLDDNTDFLKTGRTEGMDEDNRIFMGGIPFTMTEPQVREVCEAFGRLKQFNLIKDPQNP
jgi:RNA recognition motif-containing protein